MKLFFHESWCWYCMRQDGVDQCFRDCPVCFYSFCGFTFTSMIHQATSYGTRYRLIYVCDYQTVLFVKNILYSLNFIFVPLSKVNQQHIGVCVLGLGPQIDWVLLCLYAVTTCLDHYRLKNILKWKILQTHSLQSCSDHWKMYWILTWILSKFINFHKKCLLGFWLAFC